MPACLPGLPVQAYFNITVPFLAPQNYTQLLTDRGVTRAQVIQYLNQALAAPSPRCCSASCCFNQLLMCDCEPSVLQVGGRSCSHRCVIVHVMYICTLYILWHCGTWM